MKTTLLLITSLLISGFIQAQTGPGGVGSTDGSSDLVFWMDANAESYSNGNSVSSVSNLAGYGDDFSATGSLMPTFANNVSAINNMAAFTFNGSNQLESDHQGNSNENMSFFAIYNAISTIDNDIIIQHGGRNTMGINGSNKIADYVGGSNHISTHTYSGSWLINAATFANTGTNRLKYFVNNSNIDNFDHTIENRQSKTWVGGNGTGGGTKFNGSISEVFKFTKVLNDAEIIIISNYLSAKYGIALDANDHYTQDNSGSGDFDFHIAGIGQANNGTSHSNSKGTGIVQIHSPLSLDNNDFLFWGEDTYSSTHDFTTSNDYMERQNSTWRVNHVGDIGEVTVEVNSSDLNLTDKQDCAALYLIVSTSSDFSSKTSYEMELLNGVYSAIDVDLQNNAYFTFEYQDVIVISQSGYIGGSATNKAPNTTDGCYKLLVVAGADYSYNITENANVREIEVEANAEFSLATDKFLEVTGNIINNGTITVNENGSLIQQTTGINANSGAGNYIITRSGNTNSYIYNIWSSPISVANLTTVFNDANPCDMWAFEKLTQSWKADFTAGYSTTCYGNPVTFSTSNILTGGDGIMDVTRGYFIPGNLAATRTYSGQANNGDYSTSIVTTTLGNPGGTDWADDDWNLIGNPYPSGLSADSFWKENAILNQRITDALYFWDEADTNGGYNSTSDYASWNLSGGVESGNSTREPLGNIASGQGFWVVANASVDVQFNNSMRVTSNDQFFKTSDDEQHNAWFRFTSPSNYKNNILIGYNSISTDGIDPGYDAHKLVGNGHVKFASVIEQDEFVIQSMAPFAVDETKIIPLTVFTDESGIHSFTNYKTKLMPASITIYLRDLVLGTDHDLSMGSYDINLTANITYDQRFQLVFVSTLDLTNGGIGSKGGTNPGDTVNGTTGIMDALAYQDFKFIQEEGLLTINNENGFTGNIQVMDITGKQVYMHSGIENSSSETINLHGIAQGTYFISIINEQELMYIKQFVHQ